MQQPLSDFAADIDALIMEMKRRAGVWTDQELAKFMGAAQSTVSNWRKRGRVPDKAILQFEGALEQPQADDIARHLAARAIVLRLPELYFERLRGDNVSIGRHLPYSYIAASLGFLTRETERQLEVLEQKTGKSFRELEPLLIEDEAFLNSVLDWFTKLSMSEAIVLGRKAAGLPIDLDQ